MDDTIIINFNPKYHHIIQKSYEIYQTLSNKDEVLNYLRDYIKNDQTTKMVLQKKIKHTN